MKFGRQLVRATLQLLGSRKKSPGSRAILALVLLSTLGCVSAEMRNDRFAGQVSTRASSTPDWVGAAPGWAKLDRIEHWLRDRAGERSSHWKVQAELTLGEGRLDFARDEADHFGAFSPPPALWLARLSSAQSGFRRVLSDPMRSASQAQRARHGLEEVSRLRSDTRPTNRLPNRADQLARSQWRARAPRTANLNLTRGGYNRITIHHTAQVPGTLFNGSLSDSINVLQKVQRTHMEQRGYGDIGYHFLIDSEGRVFQGRDIRYQGAHAGSSSQGNNNVNNIGVCMIGNFQSGQPSPQAMSSLRNLLSELRQEYRITRQRLASHGELKATQCPGPMLARWTSTYRASGPTLASLGAGRTVQVRNTPVALETSRQPAQRNMVVR